MTRKILRWLLAAGFFTAGIFHLLRTDTFMRVMPYWVPWPREVIVVTGWCELAGAIGLLIPRTRRAAGIALALYSVCVFPANIKHMLDFAASGAAWTGWLYHGPRMLAQPVIVWWCLVAGGVIGRGRKRQA